MERNRLHGFVFGSLMLAVFVGLYAITNLTVLGQQLENSWARMYDPRSTVSYWLDEAHVVPPFHFDVLTVIIGTGAAVAIGAIRRKGRLVVLVGVAPLLTLLTGELFKHAAGRPRLAASLDTEASYPSGHAGIALAVVAALLVVVPWRQLWWSAPVLIGWALLTVAGLMAEGQHRASDVLGSGVLVVAVFSLMGAALGVRPHIGSIGLGWSRRTCVVLAVLAALTASIGALNPVGWQVLVYAATALAAVALVALVSAGLRSESGPSTNRFDTRHWSQLERTAAMPGSP